MIAVDLERGQPSGFRRPSHVSQRDGVITPHEILVGLIQKPTYLRWILASALDPTPDFEFPLSLQHARYNLTPYFAFREMLRVSMRPEYPDTIFRLPGNATRLRGMSPSYILSAAAARRPQHVLIPYFAVREMLHVYMAHSDTIFRVPGNAAILFSQPDASIIPTPDFEFPTSTIYRRRSTFEFALGNAVPSHRFWYYHRVNMEGTPFTSHRVLDTPLVYVVFCHEGVDFRRHSFISHPF
ncbi:hypothetical protein M413DRAFT_31374 [Hebeloma cylindrosporum]|uniref:Uncharacterized protein n=1 Tax=Hebeloma cylindrosporum TaxID=76867 RepID=A0A0C3BZ67_HEBCY|nr:hypothetical protein M413DRAFT_31374 [Hebeloma cylindrosporum h7]